MLLSFCHSVSLSERLRFGTVKELSPNFHEILATVCFGTRNGGLYFGADLFLHSWTGRERLGGFTAKVGMRVFVGPRGREEVKANNLYIIRSLR